MEKNYELTLPEGYKEALVLDATKKKFSFWLNFTAIMIMIVGMAVAYILTLPDYDQFSIWRILFYVALYIIYIVLHELAHGIAYKLLTKQKLKYGFTFTVAFCGVPDIYVYRKTALISLLAPFVTFSLIFLPLSIFLLLQ